MIDKKTENLIEEFLLKSEAKGEIVESTVIKYRSLLFRFFGAIEKSIFDLSLEDIDNFIIQKKNDKDNPVQATTLQTYVFALRKFVAYLKKKGDSGLEIDVNDIEVPKDNRKLEVIYLDDDETMRFLTAIQEDGTELRVVRFYALVVFMLHSGARIGEVLSIKRKDINWEKRTVAVIGKGNKGRTLMFGIEAEQRLNDYLDMRKSDNEFLFATISGKAQWRQTEVDELFRRYGGKSGINKKITSHIMRHTCATRMLRRGMRINDVSVLLGHSNVQTTLQYYIGVITATELREKITDKHYDFAPKAELEKLDFQNKPSSAGAGNAPLSNRDSSWYSVPCPS